MSSLDPPRLRPSDPLPADADWIDELYRRWKSDPSSVGSDWNHYFLGFETGLVGQETRGAEQAEGQYNVDALIEAYRRLGHMAADVDPLGDTPEIHPDLRLQASGFGQDDLSRAFRTDIFGQPRQVPLGEIVQALRDTYCRTIGVEYMHNDDPHVRGWLQAQIEPNRNSPDLDQEKKMRILGKLIDAEVFETFIQKRYLGQKRFSLEGGESLIPALDALMELATELQIEEVVMGMAHRGRLNVLANILEKPYSMIFHEFEDIADPQYSVDGDGDVKYHRGYNSTHQGQRGRKTWISLTANPSHLEAVDPVVQGRARAKQRRLDDTVKRGKVLPLLIHGDAAFAGQGLVAETFNLSQLSGYRTGGTVHIIVNNQIGFTTTPGEARSTRYSTDVAKMVGAPIFHVNGDDPEAMVSIVELALRFRQRFHMDVVVDMVCYRRHGHNEGDEPAFTQPLLYKRIRKRPSVRKLYTQKLVDCCSLSRKQADDMSREFNNRLDAALAEAKKGQAGRHKEAFGGLWKGLDHPYSHQPVKTAVDFERLLATTRTLTTAPPDFKLNPKIARSLPHKLQAVQGRGLIDWALAELLSFGTLLAEGQPVRLSGQDSVRGTFSHRHAIWYDMESQREYVPLRHVAPHQATFCAHNSMLSEAAVLGFDYGYALSEPHMLVLWEAQFGDFANGAQVIIDQFLVSSLSKWRRACGLTLLLPHGHEGQGPEHSNAYLERYLAACAEDNIQVCNLTSPANYFHVLRRQLRRNFRRPLVIMSPKSLLRHKRCASPVSEFVEGGFQEILDDPSPPRQPRRLVLCSGKIFYDLLEKRSSLEGAASVLLRVEQLYPLHRELLQRIVGRYSQVEEMVWAQEESANRGAWTYMRPLLQELFPDLPLRYCGRRASASPATGSASVHKKEQEEILAQALRPGRLMRDKATAAETA